MSTNTYFTCSDANLSAGEYPIGPKVSTTVSLLLPTNVAPSAKLLQLRLLVDLKSKAANIRGEHVSKQKGSNVFVTYDMQGLMEEQLVPEVQEWSLKYHFKQGLLVWGEYKNNMLKYDSRNSFIHSCISVSHRLHNSCITRLKSSLTIYE